MRLFNSGLWRTITTDHSWFLFRIKSLFQKKIINCLDNFDRIEYLSRLSSIFVIWNIFVKPLGENGCTNCNTLISFQILCRGMRIRLISRNFIQMFIWPLCMIVTYYIVSAVTSRGYSLIWHKTTVGFMVVLIYLVDTRYFYY